VRVLVLSDPAPTDIYTLSLHDALPISACLGAPPGVGARAGAEEGDRAPVAGEGRRRLVERRRAGHEEGGVPELVQDGLRDRDRRLGGRGREKRIGEPAEGREG